MQKKLICLLFAMVEESTGVCRWFMLFSEGKYHTTISAPLWTSWKLTKSSYINIFAVSQLFKHECMKKLLQRQNVLRFFVSKTASLQLDENSHIEIFKRSERKNWFHFSTSDFVISQLFSPLALWAFDWYFKLQFFISQNFSFSRCNFLDKLNPFQFKLQHAFLRFDVWRAATTYCIEWLKM